MKTKILLILVLALSLLLVACNSKTESPAAEAPAAEAPAGDEEQPSAVEQPTEEAAPAAPQQALFGEDFVNSMDKFLLRPDDMPNEYKIPVDGEKHNNTLHLIQDLGEIDAKKYVAATGRVDGWFLQIERRNKEDFSPSEFESTVEMFEPVLA